MNTVAIIGAGPAGLATAIKLKEEGFDSIVLEEHEQVGTPENCSGLISKTGLDEYKLGLDEVIQNKIRGAKIFSPSGVELKVTRPNTVAYVVDRKKFDLELLKIARNKNIHVSTNTKLLDIRKNTLFVQSNERGEMRKAEYIVGADGVNSTVRHLIGLRTTRENFVHTIQANCIGNFEKEYAQLYLGDFAKGFFAWVIPINEKKARIGLGNILGENITTNFKEFITQKIPDAKVFSTKSSLIPYGLPLEEIQKDNIALVGDAAFQVKASTGGGIVFGMKAGNILGETIADTIKKKAKLSDYEKRLSNVNKELKMHWKIRKYANSLDNNEIDKLFEKLKAKGIEEFLEQEGNMDEPSKFVGKLAKKPAYWFMAKTLLGIARS